MRPIRTPAAAPRSSRRLLRLILAGSGLLPAVSALAAPSYNLIFQRSGYGSQYNVTQATPLAHADAFLVPGTTNGTCTFTGSAFAYPGHVGIDNRMDMEWSGGLSGSARYDVYSTAVATDFVITGPSGPTVAGELHLRVRAHLGRAGGYAGNAAHGARLNVDARARSGWYVASGDLYSTNYDTHGTGVLAGLTIPDLDFAFVLPGTFPVDTPFDVYLRIFGTGTVYGNSTTNPGHVWMEAAGAPGLGLLLEEVDGQVMTLPAGYTLNSVSWGVVDNHFSSAVGVSPGAREPGLRLSLHPNPFAGTVRLSLEQPRAGRVRLQLFDVGGRLVRTLADGWQNAGERHFVWDGRTESGAAAAAGIYLARVEFEGQSLSRRLVRVR